MSEFEDSPPWVEGDSEGVSPAVDVSSVMSAERRAGVALHALARLQDAAAAAGKKRMSWRRRQRRLVSGGSEESALTSADSEVSVNPDLPAELQAYEAHTRGTGAAWVATPGMATTRTKYRRSDTLGTVLGSVVQSQGWDHSEKLGSIMAKWSQIVGEQVAAHCVVESFDEDRVIIRCDSTAWMNQMKLLLPHIERRIDEEVGAGVVKQTVIRGPQAPSWKRGKWSVSGRGPRDTYG